MADPRTVPLLGLALAALAGYAGYSGSGIELLGLQGVEQREARVTAATDSLKALEADITKAKRELARGTLDDLRRALEQHRASLGLLRRLVPERNEVPNLLDNISTRAKVRGVSLSLVTPMPLEAGPAPYDTYKYQVSVVGRYDQVGEFLSDIASLERIIVPYGISLAPAAATQARALGDTTGALLEARFQIRTYVKSATAGEEAPSGT